ncbi:hypothetical protein D3C85_893440 [compost metagenome]
MRPVAGSRVSPFGRPVAVKVSVSPLSTSWNCLAMSTGVMTSLSLLLRSSSVTPGVRIGLSLVPVMVMVSVAVSVAPCASETV